jgi:transposase
LTATKVATCPDAIVHWLRARPESLERVGMETGPLAVWLWNALTERGLPVICIDARHANGVLKMMPNKTDRHDARGFDQRQPTCPTPTTKLAAVSSRRSGVARP